MIGTSSSSSTEAWLVHPEPDTWLALSASIATLGLDGASLAAPGEEGAAGAGEEEAASGAVEELEGAAAAVSGASAPATSGTSLWEGRNGIVS